MERQQIETSEPFAPPVKKKHKRWLRVCAYLGGLIILLIGVIMVDGWKAMGTSAKGERLKRMQQSPNYKNGKFINSLERRDGAMSTMLWKWMKGVDDSSPETSVKITALTKKDFVTLPSSGLRFTWLGHSTMLIEIDGKLILTDPLWSKRISFSSFLGPTRFFPPPLPLTELPSLDAVIISHDHYDHLDYQTILELNKSKPLFVMPLGVGAHLIYWGVATEQIIELDWWEETKIGDVTLVATPARHSSGRSIFMLDKDETLWAGWAIIGNGHRVFFSGDTAMFPGFAQIGQRLGPFDVTMLDSGAYDNLWPDWHLGPEQAIAAHKLLRGKLMVPIHWGTFDLALHPWTEPAERLMVAAPSAGVNIAIPWPGQSIDPASPPPLERWWPKLPWRSVSEAPVISTGLGE